MNKDPYQYFRIEARELLDGLNQGILELERGSQLQNSPVKDSRTKEIIARLLRMAHTLKGAARVVRQQIISEKAHAIEDILAPHRDGETHVAPERIKRLFLLTDEIGVNLKLLDSNYQRKGESSSAPIAEELFESARIPIVEMDAVLNGVSEAIIYMGSFHEEIENLERAYSVANSFSQNLIQNGSTKKTEELRTLLERTRRMLPMAVERVERELLKVRAKTNELRLLPASSIFASLQRSIRDAGESLQKQVEFETSGGDVKLDAHVLAALRDALLQVVRNAVAHGIEKETERVGKGKSPSGRISLHVERRGNRVAFVSKDDGRGIDLEAVRRTAVSRGFISTDEVGSLSLEQAIQLLLQGGVSTSRAVSQVSGRGVGLDIVRDTVSRLKGTIKVQTELSRGTTIDICVPVSIESLVVLTVNAGGINVSIPLDSVRHTLRVSQGDIAQSSDGQSILFNDQAIPFSPLTKILRRPISKGQKNIFLSTIIVQAGTSMAAIGVDRIIGTENIIMRPLPTIMNNLSFVSGTSFDRLGDPQPILDPVGLIETVMKIKGQVTVTPATKRPSILVIDDSLTTRMLEQSILESAGYEVTLAISGEQALEKALKNHYALFVVDVEMPGMNGFEFIERAKANPSLMNIPAILVTSLASPEDRQRGEKAGARAHIMKSEFNEGKFLHIIRNLIGQEK